MASEHPATGRNGAAATSHPRASRAAVAVLKDGGTAVDAAIAANAVLAVAEPTGCGPGGDLFALVWDPDSVRLVGLNASGRAPLGMDLDDLRSRLSGRSVMPMAGALTITVPGAVDGWFMLHARFGRLPMERLLRPAIDAARDGFEVTPVIAGEWAASIRRLESDPDLADAAELLRVFAPLGRAPDAGTRFTNPDLADTLELIARDGRAAFYRGSVADAVDRCMRRIGGPIRAIDFAAHSGSWVRPLSADYRGFTIAELPPNGQGVSVLQMLRLLEPYDLTALGSRHPDAIHLQVEAKKLAFEDRARYYADADAMRVTVDALLDEGYLNERRALISMDQALAPAPPGHPPGPLGDTVYLATADSEGMMVSLIQSNYLGLGSGIVAEGTGFGLQNRGALFALRADHANAWAPGKRPFHTIIPGFILRHGRPVAAFGVMGGDMQPQGQVQILSQLIDHGADLQQAGDAPRWRHDGSSTPRGEEADDAGVVILEDGFESSILSALERRGHRVRFADEGDDGFGGYQAVYRQSGGMYLAATERRKDGIAIAY